MAFTQAPLPFAKDALESSGMKAETFDYHYGKHHVHCKKPALSTHNDIPSTSLAPMGSNCLTILTYDLQEPM